MNILVIGSEGLIGRPLAEYLSTNHEVEGVDLATGFDASDQDQVNNLVERKRFDAVINLFAVNDSENCYRKNPDFLNFSLAGFSNMLEVNVTSLYSVCSAYIKNNDVGVIVNFSSIYGLVSPNPRLYSNGDKHPAYGASKAAVISLTKYFAMHARGFRVNCIVPGGVENHQTSEFRDYYSNCLPLGRMMRADELFPVVDLCLSESSSYMTGSILTVDGGWTIS